MGVPGGDRGDVVVTRRETFVVGKPVAPHQSPASFASFVHVAEQPGRGPALQLNHIRSGRTAVIVDVLALVVHLFAACLPFGIAADQDGAVWVDHIFDMVRLVFATWIVRGPT